MENSFLIAALILALGFEFINGFHDTANAVATVIYTRTLKPTAAVIWSGLWNLIGALCSSGAVAYSIIALLPLYLLHGDSLSSVAMIFSVLLSAIIWNFSTWYLGLPVSSSHTLIGSILGVGISATALLPDGVYTKGIDWHKVEQVFISLLISPLIGFVCSAILMLLFRRYSTLPKTYAEQDNTSPPPLPLRALLIMTSTGVSFAHGSNDGQKGMGLVMLILAALFPGLYAFDAQIHAIPFWVKLMVAIVLGCGTMIGWKRVVVTVGERIGKEHLTYTQGAAAELVAMSTIFAADIFGMPVSTTHVLSSGVAGTMLANRSGLQPRTLRNILLAWIFTLPVCVLLGAGTLTAALFFIFNVFAGPSKF